MIKNILASVAAAGLLVAPVAAQANTRASDNQVSLASLGDASARTGSITEGSEKFAGVSLALIIAIFGSVAAFLIWVAEQADDEGDDASPGTGG